SRPDLLLGHEQARQDDRSAEQGRPARLGTGERGHVRNPAALLPETRALKRGAMRKAIIIVTALLVAAFFGGKMIAQALLPAPGQPVAADPEQVRKGEAFLDLHDTGRYEDALAMTTPKVQEALASGKLQ